MNSHDEWNDAARKRLAELQFIFQRISCTQDELKEMTHLNKLEKTDDLNRFGYTLQWLTQFIYEKDPIELVPCGMPHDEYDIEARKILKELAIRGTTSLDEIVGIVHQIFVKQFGTEEAGTINRLCYTEIAKELLARTEEWKDK